MGHLIRECVRCGVLSQLDAVGLAKIDDLNAELFMVCKACGLGSIYQGQPAEHFSRVAGALDSFRFFSSSPVIALPNLRKISNDVPSRVRDLFQQANRCLRLSLYDAAGAMFRKTIDVATKELYANDPRLADRKPADAPRSRIAALGQLKILDEEIVEL